jgi:hypothetical protein
MSTVAKLDQAGHDDVTGSPADGNAVPSFGVRGSTGGTFNGNVSDQHVGLARQLLLERPGLLVAPAAEGAVARVVRVLLGRLLSFGRVS